MPESSCGLPHISRPCRECPWRVEAEAGKFTAERYDAMRSTSDQSGLNAPMFACHMTKEGRQQACAGWLAVEGENHLGVRFAVITGWLNPEAVSPGKGWPALHDSYDALVTHQGFEGSGVDA